GEQLVGGKRGGAGQPVEERGLPRIGIADERDGAHRRPAACPALRRALALHVREPVLQYPDPLAEQPAVRFELLFAGSAEADAALLPLEVGPAAHKPCELVLHLSELDLELPFGASRSQREDVEDETRSI